MVRAERPGAVRVVRAADRCHLGPEVSGDLDRQRAHPARRAEDRDPLARLHAGEVAQEDQRRHGAVGQRGGLFVAEAGGHPRDATLFGDRDPLGVGAALLERAAEHVVADAEAGDGGPDLDDAAGEHRAGAVPRAGQPHREVGRDPDDAREVARADAAVGVGHRAGVDLDQDLALQAYGLSVSSALHASPPWTSGVFGYYTQLGVVVARRLEPVVRYAFLMPARAVGQHDLAVGANWFVHGHTVEVQTGASLRSVSGRLDEGELTFKTQLGLAF